MPAVVAHSAGVAGRVVPWAPLKLLSLATPWWPVVDPGPTYEWFVRRGPVVSLPGSKWLICAHEPAQRLLLDLGMSSDVSTHLDGKDDASPYDRLMRSSLAYKDPPEHARHRRPASTHFGRKAVAQWADVAQAMTAELARPLVRSGRGDVVAAVAEPVTDAVMFGLCGLPSDRSEIVERLGVMSRRFENSPVSSARIRRRADEATTAMFDDPAFVGEPPAGSLLDTLTRAAADDPGLGEAYATTNTIFVFGAGRNALITLTSSAVVLGASHPQAWRRAGASLEEATTFVHEVLRWDPPARFGFRVAPNDLDVGGQAIPRGSDVAVLFGAANRDPAVFDRPNEFSMEREPNRHLSYGGGIHHCIGGPLATAMVAGIVHELAAALGPITIDRVRYHSGTPTRRPTSLIARWQPGPGAAAE